jgi:hypothetical protein
MEVNMFPNYYANQNLEKINAQINELERLKQQIQQPAPITQNFQIAPNNFMRYANSYDDVMKNSVMGDTPFFSQDMTVLWVKKATGEVKSYEVKEIIEKDEKDVKIELLMAKINELEKGMKLNAKSDSDDVNESVESEKSTSISKSGKSNTE